MSRNPDEVLLNYGVRPSAITPITIGLINKTYRVEEGVNTYILQKLHKIFDYWTLDNVAMVSRYLRSSGLLAPQPLFTLRGHLGVYIDECWWRLQTYIPGRVFVKAENPDLMREAGSLLGRFHCLMREYKGRSLHRRRRPHDTRKHYRLFLRSLPEEVDGEIRELAEVVKQLPSLYLPVDLPAFITHGDPKISNLIFHPWRNAARALIDFDSCNDQNNVIVELGDAFRSWCASYEEDGQNQFDLEKFSAGWQGYLAGGGQVSETEKMLVPRAIKLIALELASRFLRDYFEDSYFSWDEKKYPSRRAHNLARAKAQINLYRDLAGKERYLEEVIEQE